MKAQVKLYRSIIGVALVTALILLVPCVAMQFTDEVNWSATDFIIMGAILFTTGFLYKLITMSSANVAYRVATGLALGAMLFMIWANLGVGLIGSGPNLGNLMYIGVLVVGIIGTILSHLSPAGMERAMYATALAVLLVAAIALLANMHQYPGSSVAEILGVSGLFAMLFTLSGLLFRYAGKERGAART
jgi:hypothetical protein